MTGAENGVAPRTGEIRSLTGLRGVAACLVVWFHCCHGVVTLAPFDRMLDHGYIWVDLFFVLSGFLMPLAFPVQTGPGFWRRHGIFLGRRLARIYPLYLLATLISLCLIETLQAGWPWIRLSNPFGLLLANVLMLQNAGWFVPGAAHDWSGSADSAAWSLSTEWIAYLVYPALAVLCVQGGPRRAAAALIVALFCLGALAFSVVPLAPDGALHPDVWSCRVPLALRCPVNTPFGSGPLDVWGGDAPAVIRCMAEFSLGLLSFRVWRDGRAAWLTARPYAAPVICAAILVLLPFRIADVAIVMLFPPLILALLNEMSVATRLLGGRFCHRLGLWSYSLYMVHEPLRQSSAFDWVRQHMPNVTSAAALTLAAVFLIVIPTYEYVERPSRAYLRRLLAAGAAGGFLGGHRPAA